MPDVGRKKAKRGRFARLGNSTVRGVKRYCPASRALVQWKNQGNHSHLPLYLSPTAAYPSPAYSVEHRNNNSQFATDLGLVPVRVQEEYTLRVSQPPIILIPAKVSREAEVEGVQVKVGTSMYLMKDVTISPGFLCLLLRRGP